MARVGSNTVEYYTTPTAGHTRQGVSQGQQRIYSVLLFDQGLTTIVLSDVGMILYELKALIWRQRCAGTEADPRLAAALRRMIGTTEQLTKLFRDRNGDRTIDAAALLGST